VHIVGLYYKNVSRYTVLWMSDTLTYFIKVGNNPEYTHGKLLFCRNLMRLVQSDSSRDDNTAAGRYFYH